MGDAEEEGDDNPFHKKSKVARTPPQRRERGPSAGEFLKDKRKRDSSVGSSRWKDVVETMTPPILVGDESPEQVGKRSREDWHPSYLDANFYEYTGMTKPCGLLLASARERRRESYTCPGEVVEIEDVEIKQAHAFQEIEKLSAGMANLKGLVAIHTNTQGDIKKAIKALDHRIRYVREEMEEWLDRCQSARAFINKVVKTCNGWHEKMTEPPSTVRPTMVNAGTQTVAARADTRSQEKADLGAIRQALSEGGDVEKFREILDRKWTREDYADVSMVHGGDILSLPRDWDIAILTDREFGTVDGGNNKFRSRYQGIEELQAQEGEAGDFAYLLDNMGIPNKKGEVTAISRNVWYGYAAEHRADPWNGCDIFSCIEKIKQKMVSENRKKIAFAESGKVNGKTLGRLLQFIFSGSNIGVKIFMDKPSAGTKGADTPPMGLSSTRARPSTEEAVILRVGEGTTYAQMLGRMRNSVDVNKIGVQVTAINRTRSGDLLVAVKKTQESNNSDVLRQEILKNLEGVRVDIVKEKKVAIHIQGLDGATTKEELVEAVMKEAKDGRGECEVKALWPAHGGNQNAAALLSADLADRIISRGSIKVGWLACKVRKRVELLKCYKCWEYGHLANDCSGVDRSKKCMKCGGEGHKAANCQEEEECWTCQKKGHRAGSMRCPEFRRQLLVAGERSKAK